MRVDMSTYVFWAFFASLFLNRVCGNYELIEPRNVTNKQANVSCGGGQYASDCSRCPYDKYGNYHGGFRCSGDCRWLKDKCKTGEYDTL